MRTGRQSLDVHEISDEGEMRMKTLLFFDDWPIQEQRGVDRVWFRAEPWPGLEPQVDSITAKQMQRTEIRT